MRKPFGLVFFLCMGLVFAEEKGEKWDHAVNFQTLPNEGDPQWTKGGVGEAVIEDGKLILRSDLEGGIAFSLKGKVGDPVWDSTKPTTIQFRARVVSSISNATAAHVSLRTGEVAYLIPVQGGESHVYHFLVDGDGVGRLFIDGAEQSLIKGRPIVESDFVNGVTFGDLGNKTGGETEWTDFRWTNNEAFEPTP